MAGLLGPRRQRLLTAWGVVGRTHRTGPGYDLTRPTRSERCRGRLATFIDDPTPDTFETLWQPDAVAAAAEWYPGTIQNLWPESLGALAAFLETIRAADSYDPEWETRASWDPGIVQEVFSRTRSETPIVSATARRGLAKFGVSAGAEYAACRSRLVAFRDEYERYAGHVTAEEDEPIGVFAELDELFTLVTSVDGETIRAEVTGPRGELYEALRGYPAPESGDRGPIDVDFAAATPAIEGHLAARAADAYADTDTAHWAGTHYERWKWDFAEYVTGEVLSDYDVTSLSPAAVEGFLEAFWGNADEYTDTAKLSTPVPQYLLGSWGVRQFADFRGHCLDDPAEAAAVLSGLFDEGRHLVDRLERFHAFGQAAEISDGNLLRVATTFLMGAYPDRYVNFQYERFDTFLTDCSSAGSLETGYDARQYYRIVLACRDIRDALAEELPEANMLDVHTLIRLYQDYLERA